MLLNTEKLTPWRKISALWKYQPEDFIVKEISRRYGLLDFSKKYSFDETSHGDHLICVFIKKNMETFQMIKSIALMLNISSQRISLAGVKDKKAWTIQLGSIYKIKKEKINFIRDKLKNCDVIPICYADKKVYLGELDGNFFEITLRCINKRDVEYFKEIMIKYEKEYDFYFPNYYGIQRFGSEENSTAKLGYLLLKRDYERFILEYLSITDAKNSLKNLSSEEIEKLREKLRNKYHEKRVFDYLLYHNMEDIIGAIRTIPIPLLKMFVNAYQSHIFNMVLSKIIKEKKSEWHELKNKKIPIPGSGYESFALKGEYEGYIMEILEKEKITFEDFKFPELNFESKGTGREILTKPANITYLIEKDEIFKRKYKIILKFSLTKGSYASSFLEEIFDLSY